MHKIHYICHYNDETGFRELITQPSGITKINYIKSSLKKAGYYVIIFSVAEATENKNVIYYANKRVVDENEEIVFTHSFGRPSVVHKIASRLWMQIQLVFYLLSKAKTGDIILVYHSLVLKWPIRIVKLLKRNKVIMEVEELYSAALQMNNNKIESEKKYLRNVADGYILVNDIIGKKCMFSKPATICYGDYKGITLKRNKFNDNKIHIVYAGVIDKEGTDAYVAVDTINYLPNNYHIHILGYGLSNNISKLKDFINTTNETLGLQGVTYDGCLSGEEYNIFLSKCDIGLCTRVLTDNLSDYTFPSKVLVYLGNGLIPICSPISSVIKSNVKDYVVFTKDITPKSVAEAILSINEDKQTNNKINLDLLDQNFIKSLILLLNSK